MEELSSRLMYISAEPVVPDLWTTRSSGVTYNDNSTAVIWSGQKFVAKLNQMTGGANSVPIAMSANSLTGQWTVKYADVTSLVNSGVFTSSTYIYWWGPIFTTGSGTLVIVGGSYESSIGRCIAYSTDHGETWSVINGSQWTTGTGGWHHLAYGNGTWVVAGDSKFGYSYNLTSWTYSDFPPSITAGGNFDNYNPSNKLRYDFDAGIFVLYSRTDGTIAYSMDGITWQTNSFTRNGNSYSGTIHWLRRFNNRWVASFDNYSLGYSPSLHGSYQTGGGTSAPSISESGNSLALKMAEEINGTLITTGVGGRYYYSTDGMNWTAGNSGNSIVGDNLSYYGEFNTRINPIGIFKGEQNSLGYDENLYIQTSTNNFIKSVDNGLTWSASGSWNDWWDIYYSEYSNLWIGIKPRDGVYTSTNAINWSKVLNVTAPSSVSNFSYDSTGQNIFFTVPGTVRYYMSANGGSTWTSYTKSGNVMPGYFGNWGYQAQHYVGRTLYANSNYIAYGFGNFYKTTSPTVVGSWSSGTLPGSYSTAGGANSSGIVIVQSGLGLPEPTRWRSSDTGSTWTHSGTLNIAPTSWSGGTYSIKDHAYGNNIWVRSGDRNDSNQRGMWYSTNNGATWELSTSTVGNAIEAIAWDSTNSRFIAIQNNYMYQSTNGTSWTTLSGTAPTVSIFDVAVNGNFIVGSSNQGYLAYSSNGGSSWTNYYSGVQMLNINFIPQNSSWVSAGTYGNVTRVYRSTSWGSWSFQHTFPTNYKLDQYLYYKGHSFVTNGTNTILLPLINYNTSDVIIGYSLDNGATWSNTAPISGVYGYTLIFWNGTEFLGYSSNGKKLSSTNGTTWTVTNTVPSSYFAPCSQHVEVNGTECRVGRASSAYSSDSGHTWTVNHNGVPYSSIIYSETLQKFIAVGGQGFSGVFTSSTGYDNSWTCEGIISDFVRISNISFNPYKNVYYVVGRDSLNNFVVYQSSNLSSWSLKHTITNSNSTANATSFSVDTVAVVGQRGASATSNYTGIPLPKPFEYFKGTTSYTTGYTLTNIASINDALTSAQAKFGQKSFFKPNGRDFSTNYYMEVTGLQSVPYLGAGSDWELDLWFYIPDLALGGNAQTTPLFTLSSPSWSDSYLGFWLYPQYWAGGTDWSYSVITPNSSAGSGIGTNGIARYGAWNHLLLRRMGGSGVFVGLNGISNTFAHAPASGSSYSAIRIGGGIPSQGVYSPVYIDAFHWSLGNSRFGTNSSSYTVPTTAPVATANTIFMSNFGV